MPQYETSGTIEHALQRKAAAEGIPISGTLELTDACNLHCNMCYVRHGVPACGMLDGTAWISILEQLRDAGTLYVLLSGGEPLLHPDFMEIYLAAQRMGMVVSVNTNAAIIDEEWADFFADYPCKRLNISLYGADAAAYDALCHRAAAFEKVSHALELLHERGVCCRLSFTMTNENRRQLRDMAALAGRYEMPFFPACYLFPPGKAMLGISAKERFEMREGNLSLYVEKCELHEGNPDFYGIKKSDFEKYAGEGDGVCNEEMSDFSASRMTPQEAAGTRILSLELTNPGALSVDALRMRLNALLVPEREPASKSGLTCHAGKSGFWIDSAGRLYACGQMRGMGVPLECAQTERGMLEESKQTGNCVSEKCTQTKTSEAEKCAMTKISVSGKCTHTEMGVWVEHAQVETRKSFSEAWEIVRNAAALVPVCHECAVCRKKSFCQSCAAASFLETGDSASRPQYLCDMTDAYVRLLVARMPEDEQQVYLDALVL